MLFSITHSKFAVSLAVIGLLFQSGIAIAAAPVVETEIPNQAGTQGDPFSLDVSGNFSDPDGDTLSFGATPLPDGLSITGSVISGTPTQAGTGTTTVTVTATEVGTGDLFVTDSFDIVVSDPNLAPEVETEIPNQTGTQGTEFSLDVSSNFSDPDGDTLSFGATPLPDGLSITGSVISGTPTQAGVGTTTVTVTATEVGTGDLFVTDGFDIVVANTNDQPEVDTEIPNQAGTQGDPFSLDVSGNFSDPDGDTLSFGATPLPDGLSITGSVISGTPTQAGTGTTTVTVTATEVGTGDLFVTDSFDIVVSDPNLAPEVETEIPNQTGTQGTEFSLDVSSNFSDPDGDTLSFGATPLPDGLSITGSVISGTPTQAGVGTTTVTVTATEVGTGDLFVTDGFDIVVANTNDQPEVDTEIPNQAGTQGDPFSLDVSGNFSDPDGDTLSFGATPLPDGLSITGSVISGTPTQAGTGTTTVTVTATEVGTGDLFVTDSFDIVVSDPNLAPEVETEIPNQTGTQGTEFSLDVSSNFSDPDGDTLSFGATPLPDGLSITGSVISGTPTQAGVGTTTVTVTATEVGTGDLFVTDGFDIVVANTNDQPEVDTEIPNQAGTQGDPFSLDVSGNFSDPDGDTLSFGATPLPDGLSITGSVISGTPTQAGTGTTTVTVTATEVGTGDLFVTDSFDIVVSDPNLAPEVETEIPNQTGTQGTEFSLDVSSNFSDPDGDTLSFGATPLPDGLSITGSVISGTPTQAGVGTTTVTVTATEVGTGDLFVTDGFDIVVANTNDQPEVDTEIPNQAGTQGDPFSLDVSGNFSDPDGDTLSFGATPLPDGLSITGSVISGTPTQAGVGTTTVTVTATEVGTGDLFVTDSFDIVVSDPNLAPEVETEIPNQTGTQGTEFSLDVSSNFSDPDGDTLSFGATPLPDGLSITGSVISGTPTQAGVGTTTVTVTATEVGTGDLFVTDGFDIVVANTNDQPEVDTEIPNQAGTQGDPFSLDVSGNFSDPDGDTLSFGATPLPDGLSITGSVISGTPTQAGVGTTTVTVTATEVGTGDLFVTDSFDIVVSDPNLAPEVETEIPNQTGTQGTEFSLDVSSNFSDPDGDTLSFGATPLPDGLSITGSVISGTPTQAGVGTTTVTVTATEVGTDSLSVTDTFDIVVADPNLPPVVLTSVVNQSVSISVLVDIDVSSGFSDPDGDSVTFTASGLPDGLSITAAGVIQGTPSDLDQGPNNVTVTASDPLNATGTDTFVLTVAQPPNVVLIFADDLGYGDIGVYGASGISTPNIDSIASDGVRFTDFYASPTCGASRSMLLTGSYAPRVSLGVGQVPSLYTGIHQDEITLAELLGDKGYATSLVGKWHLGDHHQYRPLRHGFDEFYGLAYSSNMWPFHPRTFQEPGEDPRLTDARNRAELTGYQGQGNSFPRGRGYPNLPLYDGDTIVEFNSLQDTFGTRFVDEGINFINRNASGPFFLYLALTAPHVPLHPASEFVGTSGRGLYGDAVQEIDDGIGRILARLDTLGIADNTLVMFVSDNGPWLEYGIDGGSAGPLSGGKGTPFEGGIRVPAIMRWADRVPANTVTSEPASLIDILPTLAPLAGTTVPVDRTIDGVSLVSLITGSASTLPARSIFSFDETSTSTEVDLESVRDGPWKLHVSTVSGSVSSVSLYNLDQDIDESNNVLGSQSAIAATMRAAGQAVVNEISAGQRPLGSTSFDTDPFLQYEGAGDLIIIEAEHAHSNIARGSHAWQLTTPPGASGDAGMQALPNNGTNNSTDYQTTSPQLGYNVSFESAGRYYVWVRGTAGTSNDDSYHIGLDGQAPASGVGAAGINTYYTWVGDLLSGGGRAFIDVPSVGQHTVNLWMREDGLFVDKIVLTKDSTFTPVGTGLIESRQGVGMPSLMPSDNNLTFSVDAGAGAPPDQTVSLDTSDGTQANYTIEASQPWLSATPTTGNTKADLVVSVDPTGLTAGTYNGTLMISAPGYPDKTIAVTLVIVEPPPLSMLFSVNSLSFAAVEGGPSPPDQSVALSTSDSQAVGYSINSNVGWLSASPLAGTTPSISIDVAVNSGVLSAGTHIGTLTVSGSGYADDTIAVTINVSAPSSAFQQDPATGLVSMEVENYQDLTSAGVHSWTPVSQPGASGGQSLQALPNNGTNINSRNDVASSPRIDLLVNFAQTGTHYIWLRGLAPSGADNTVHAGLDGVAPNTADGIRNFTNSWSWTNATLGAAATRAFINVTSVGEHVFNVWMREDGLILDKVILTTDPSFTPSGEGPDESVQGPGLPSMVFNASVLDFVADTGGSPPTNQTIALDTSDGQPVTFSIGSDQSWLSATPSSGTTPAGSVSVSVDHSSLMAGSYSGTLTVSGTGYQGDTIAVALEVTDPPPLSMQFDVSSLNFSADEAGPSPADQTVSLSTTDSAAIGFSIGSNVGWLSSTPSSGTTPVGSIAVSVNSGVLAAGTHTGILTASSAGYLDDTITVTVVVAGQSSAFRQDSGSGLVSIEVENFSDSLAAGAHDWVATSEPGASGSGSLQALPNTGTRIGSRNNVSSSPRLDFLVDFSQTGVHYLWLRGLAPRGADDTAHAGFNGIASADADRVGNFSGSWSWVNVTLGTGTPRAFVDVPSIGEHVVNVWMREDGLILDKLVLTTDPSFVPTGAGPDQSSQGPVQPGLDFSVASLSFSAQTGASQPADQTISLDTSDGQPVVFSIGSDQSWLSATPSSGTTPAGPISVSVDHSSLAVGSYSGTLTVSGTGYQGDTIAVSLEVIDPPPLSMQFDVSTLTFSADEAGPSPADQTVSLSTTDSQAVGYSIGSNQGWLSATPLTGTTPVGSISVSVNSGSLAAGTHTGRLTASAGGYIDDTIDVTVTVIGPSSGFQQDPSTGLVSIEVEHFDSTDSGSGHDWLPVSEAGASAGGSLQALPNNSTNINTGYETTSPQLNYAVNFVTSGTHYVWLRGIGATSNDDSAHVGLNGSGQSSADRITGFGSNWRWVQSTMDGPSATLEVPSAGEHELNIWMREDGLILDKIVLTTDSTFVPTENGPDESSRGAIQPSLLFDPTTLSFSADIGATSTSDQAVSLDTSDGSNVSFTLGSDQGWLTASLSGGTTPQASILVAANPTGLSAGTYNGVITATASGFLSTSLPVTLRLAAPSSAFQQDTVTGLVSIEVENVSETTSAGGHDWLPVSQAGAAGTGSLRALPNSGTNTGGWSNAGSGPRLDFLINFNRTGPHYLWVRGLAPSGADNTAHAGINGNATSSADRLGNFLSSWTWINLTLGSGSPRAVIDVPSTGEHVLNIWMREDGLILDKVVLTSDPTFVPSDEGPVESPQNGTLDASQAISSNGPQIQVAVGAIGVTDTLIGWTPDEGDEFFGNQSVLIGQEDAVSAGNVVFNSIDVFEQSAGDGLVSIEVENFSDSQVAGDHEWLVSGETGASGAVSLQALPNIGTNIGGRSNVSAGPRLDYVVNFVEVGRHYLWLRGLAAGGADNTVHAGLNGTSTADADRIGNFPKSWAWIGNGLGAELPRTFVDVPSPGEHVLNIWMREDGLILDKLVLTKDPEFVPTGFGPDESDQGSLQARMQFDVSTLTFSADEAGPSPADQAVSLSTTDSQAVGYSIGSNQGWLSATPLTGTTPVGSIAVSINSGVLAAGTHTGRLTASAGGYIEDTIDVTVTVSGPSSAFRQDASTGLVSIEIENYIDLLPAGGHDWVATSEPGASGSGSLQALPNTGTRIGSRNNVSSSPRLDFLVDFSQTGVHYLWLRGLAPRGADDTAHAGFNGIASADADRVGNFSGSWSWVNVTLGTGTPRAFVDVPSIGEHVVNVWMREDGLILDKLVLTTDPSFVPTGAGPDQSSQGPVQPGLDFSVASLSFSAQTGASQPADQTISLDTSDGQPVVFSIGSDQSWLSATPSSGTTPAGPISVSVDHSSLAVGSYSGTLTVSGTGYQGDTIAVSLEVIDPPPLSMQFDVSTLTFSADEAGPSPADQTVSLSTTDSQAVGYSIGSNQGWLSATPLTGTTPVGSISVSVNSGSLAAGTHTGRLTASAGGYIDDTIDVTVTVIGPSSGFQQDPSTGLVSIEVEHFDSTDSGSGHDWLPVSEAGASAGGSLQALPNNSTNINTGYETTSPQLNYAVNFVTSGTHYVWLRGIGATSNDDSAHVGLNGSGQSSADRVTGFGANWRWVRATMDGPSATLDVTSSGENILNIWMREDGLILDKIVLTPDAGYTPTGTGPDESSRGAIQPSLLFDPTTLSFSADIGATSTPDQTVSLDTSDGSNAGFTLGSDQSWLTASLSGGTTPQASILVTADPTGLPAGTYNGNISAAADGWQSASVAVTLSVLPPLSIEDNFNSGNASQWTPVPASNYTAVWQVVDGAYQQLSSAPGSVSGTDTYLQGAYALLNTRSDIEDFLFSVEIEPLASEINRRGDDVGVMFRYIDGNNYYRLSVNSKFGQTRLERVLDGQFKTLAVTSQGYLPDQILQLAVRVVGPAILVYKSQGATGSSFLDDEPYLAAYDAGLAVGSVALYTQSQAAFDNVTVESYDGIPRVGLLSPRPFAVDFDNSVAVSAVIASGSGSETVSFERDGLACGGVTASQPGLYTGTCDAISSGEHDIEVILKDGVIIGRDSAITVGTGGDKAIALGDSITNGFNDNVVRDNIGVDIQLGGQPVGPRQIAFRGYESILHNLLTEDTSYGVPNVFYNEGIPGDHSDELAFLRIDSILERHPEANIALVQIGTNDANLGALSSGIGCGGAACDGTFKGNLLDLVDTLEANSVTPIFALAPPIFGRVNRNPYDDPFGSDTPNPLLIDYNTAVSEIRFERGLLAGPDFFAWFLGDGENRITLFDDLIHPNALGYAAMAGLWRRVFAPGGSMPLVLEGICIKNAGSNCQSPITYKQNLLQIGDLYYRDRTYTLSSIPSVLDSGVWIVPDNDDKANSRDDYLAFDIDRNVTVYIAYSPSATSLPDWMASFADTGFALGVAAGVPSLNLFSKDFSANSRVTLGGNLASGAVGGGNNNYLVIVVPR